MDKVFTNGRMYVCIFIADVQNDHTVLLFAIFLSSFGEIVAEKFELNTYILSSFPGFALRLLIFGARGLCPLNFSRNLFLDK